MMGEMRLRSKRLRSGSVMCAEQREGKNNASNAAAVEGREVEEEVMQLLRGATRGSPRPLGPSRAEGGGVNFAVFSRHAANLVLVVYKSSSTSSGSSNSGSSSNGNGNGNGRNSNCGAAQLLGEVPMYRDDDESLGVWHVVLPALPQHGIEYGLRVFGHDGSGWSDGNRWDSTKVLLDPYAPLVRCGRRNFGVRDAAAEGFDAEHGGGSCFRGAFDLRGREFNWGGDAYKRPNIAWQDLVIYEMAVRSFTADTSSSVATHRRGTYRGIIDKISHFRELGVNAVELLPVFEYDELEFQRTPNPRDHMVNAWGYSHISFFAPMSRYVATSYTQHVHTYIRVRAQHAQRREVERVTGQNK